MSNDGFSRKRFLTGATTVGVAAAAGQLMTAGGAAATETTNVRASGKGRRGLEHRGVVYTVGEGASPATRWNAARMREDIRVIAEDLHADSIEVTGDGVDRLVATSSEAAEQGLHVWLQPTLADESHDAILDHIAESGRHAARLRRQGATVDFSVGCEFWLFVPGIVPGANPQERAENVEKGNVDWERMTRRLRDFTARAATVGRSVFPGRLSYAAAQDDTVDWNLFDIVCIDYYSHLPRRADYVRELRKHLRWGKPLAIGEFGTCAYVGAPDSGGMGWNIVDYSTSPPEIVVDLERSERTQAEYLLELLDVFEAMGLYAAMAFEFVTPDQQHRSNPRYDLDLASYGIVKPIRDRPDDPTSDWHWEPKQAFHALSDAYGRARPR